MGNIFFVGMMGSGKTTTAREFAKLHPGFQVVDIDFDIEQKAGKTINQIFSEENGEVIFREFEKKALAHVSSGADQVIATGGGIVLIPENIERMRSLGKIVYLKTSFPMLWSRVKHSKVRPLLKTENPEETFEAIFNARVPIYERIADFTVVTDGKTPGEVAKEISETFFK